MAALSNYLETAILNHTLGIAAYTAPTSVYVALFTTGLTAAGGGTEVSGTGYARQLVTFPSATVVSAQGQVANSNTVLFGPATGSGWGTIQSMAIYDAATGGNMLYFAPVSPVKTITTNDSLQWSAGAIVLNNN